MDTLCSNCGTLNPATAKFCSNCGTTLVGLCSECGGALPAGARFCPDCGRLAAAGSVSDGARLAQLAATVPPPLAEKVRTARVTGERRIVTSLFADVVGSTALAEQMDPEQWAIILNGAFERLSQAIYRYEGTIARLMGDALLAFFGAPVAHEDDPVRAVRAALDVIATARAYSQELGEAYGIEFQVRVGLSTGPVVVGNIGSNLLYEYTALGDSVNLAARMQTLARPMTVLISEQTYRFVRPLFDFADLGEIEVKGRRAPVRVYEVGGVRAEPGRVRGVQGLRSPLVGRAAELDTLLALSRTVEAGLGRVAVIVGEPGLGKSRLVAEWKACADEAMQWVEGHCLSYGGGLADHLVVDLLRALLGVDSSAARQETQTALRGLVADLFDGEAIDIYPYLADLLSLDLEDEQRERLRMLDSRELRLQYGSALERLLTALAARHPLALVLEDIHWADPSSTDLLARLLPLATRTPLLFCLVSRPDRDAAGWKLVDEARSVVGSGLREVTLEPLPEAASRQLVSNLLEIEALPVEVRDLILEKAEGNPFFVEEMIRELIERQVIFKRDQRWVVARAVETVHVPDNLQALLLGRIDRLPDDAKQTLRVASVVGRRFSVPLLETVVASSHLAGQLSSLESAGLIELDAVQPELQYLFRHALLHEAAYDSLLHHERRQLHLAVGEALERHDPDRVTERAATLGHHFEQGQDWERALHYFTLAAGQARQRDALQEAVSNYSHALAATEHLQASRLALYRARGQLYETLGAFDSARADHESALTLARQSSDQHEKWQALLDLGFLWAARNYDRSGDYFQQALALAQGMNDDRAIAYSLNRVGNWHYNMERVREAQRYHQEALAIFQRLGDQAGVAATMDLLGLAFLTTGDIVQAVDCFERAIGLFRELGDQRGLSQSLAMLPSLFFIYRVGSVGTELSFQEMAEEALQIAREIGWAAGEVYAQLVLAQIFAMQGAYGRALDLASPALQLAEEIGHHQWVTMANWQMGEIHRDLLAFPQAHQYLQCALDLAKQIGSLHWVFGIVPSLAWLYVQQGEYKLAQTLLDDIFGSADEDREIETLSQQFHWRTRAELALLTGDAARALAIAERLIRRNEAGIASKVALISDFVLVYASALRSVGQLAEAEAMLQAARAEADKAHAYPLLWRILRTLGFVLHDQGRGNEATRTLDAARMLVEQLAAQIPDRSLREAFLRSAKAQLSVAIPP